MLSQGRGNMILVGTTRNRILQGALGLEFSPIVQVGRAFLLPHQQGIVVLQNWAYVVWDDSLPRLSFVFLKLSTILANMLSL